MGPLKALGAKPGAITIDRELNSDNPNKSNTPFLRSDGILFLIDITNKSIAVIRSGALRAKAVGYV